MTPATVKHWLFLRRNELRSPAGLCAIGMRHGRGHFSFAGERHRYHAAYYNDTWANERTVELPLALAALERRRGGRVLEVGNVLGHHIDLPHIVVDKYELRPGVVDADISSSTTATRST